MYVSALLISLTIIYNELGTAAHWFTRNVVNGLGLGTFELGATLIAGESQHPRVVMAFRVLIVTSQAPTDRT